MLMKLTDIQPSQIYINKVKLNKVLEWFKSEKLDKYEPLPIINLNGKIVLTDGHTRAFVAYLKGLSTVNVYWDTDGIDIKAYQTFVKWCENEGITTIKDLDGRIINQEEYQRLWIKRCEALE